MFSIDSALSYMGATWDDVYDVGAGAVIAAAKAVVPGYTAVELGAKSAAGVAKKTATVVVDSASASMVIPAMAIAAFVLLRRR